MVGQWQHDWKWGIIDDLSLRDVKPSLCSHAGDVIQNYNGTNAPTDNYKINCEGIKPNWNLVISIYELNSNRALRGLNNPNPTKTVTGPTPVNEFAPGNN